MSEARENFAASEILQDSDLNQVAENANDGGGFRDDINAGETINGATTPVAVYQDTSDNELYACDADDATKLDYVGFATSNSTDGNAIDFQRSGVVRGFSGLAEGQTYYVQDDKSLGTTPGTYPIPVGKAISTTELAIIHFPKVHVSNPGITTDGAVTTSTQDKTITVSPGFYARYFKARIVVDIVGSETWAYGSNAPIGRQSFEIQGVIGGDVTWFKVEHEQTAIPNSRPSLNQYYDTEATTPEPTYGSGTSDTPGTGTISPSGYSETFELDEVSLSGKDVQFVFAFTKVANNCGLRYGVQNLVLWE